MFAEVSLSMLIIIRCLMASVVDALAVMIRLSAAGRREASIVFALAGVAWGLSSLAIRENWLVAAGVSLGPMMFAYASSHWTAPAVPDRVVIRPALTKFKVAISLQILVDFINASTAAGISTSSGLMQSRMKLVTSWASTGSIMAADCASRRALAPPINPC